MFAYYSGVVFILGAEFAAALDAGQAAAVTGAVLG